MFVFMLREKVKLQIEQLDYDLVSMLVILYVLSSLGSSVV